MSDAMYIASDGIRVCATCDAYPCACPAIPYLNADERKVEQQAARFEGCDHDWEPTDNGGLFCLVCGITQVGGAPPVRVGMFPIPDSLMDAGSIGEQGETSAAVFISDEMVERGIEAWDRVKYTYSSPADIVRAILEAALSA